MRFRRIGMSVGLMAIIALGMVGCQLFDREKDSGPTSPDMAALKALSEAGNFLYEPSESPGVTIDADFTVHHLEGTPYGNWLLTASWLGDEGLVVAETTVEVSIAEDGQGSAVLPSDFLDSVFEAANSEDHAVWLQNPGLVLNFYPADEQTLRDQRIVGGVQTSLSKWPWMAALVGHNQNAYQSQFCGGTLVHPYWVLTAAHCIVGESPSAVDVVLGTDDLRYPRERIRVSKIIKYPSYNARTNNHDIALVKLAQASRQPVADYKAGAYLIQPGRKAKVAGWGNTIKQPPNGDNGAQYPYKLREVMVPIVASSKCNASYDGGITTNMLCAGYDRGGKDSCDGDSGGPLVVNSNLVGIVSFGNGCAWKGYYGVYTKVLGYRNWIATQIARNTRMASLVEGLEVGENVGGSLSDLVEQLDLNWQPGSAPLKGVGARIQIGDPFNASQGSDVQMIFFPKASTAR